VSERKEIFKDTGTPPQREVSISWNDGMVEW